MFNPYTWLRDRPGYALLSGDVERLGPDVRRLGWAWPEAMALSLLWGLAAVVVFGWAWGLLGDPLVVAPLLPAAVAVGMLAAWPFGRALASLTRSLSPSDAARQAVIASVAVLVWVLAIALVQRDSYRYYPPLPDWLAWVRPGEKVYSVLVLMPLWGCWAMMVTCQFCRPRHDDASRTAILARCCGPLRTAVTMGLLLALTATYFSFMGYHGQFIVGGAALVASIGAGLVLCRLAGGLCQQALLGANVVTQMVFALAYIAAAGSGHS